MDLSQPVFGGCPGWPDDPPVRVKVTARHSQTGWRAEQLTAPVHTGSHIDAPRHILPRGATIDQIPLESFVGEAVIADLRDARPNEPLMSARLRRALPGSDLADKIVLLATGWGEIRARSKTWLRQPPFLAPEAARWLVKRKVRAVGIDHHSIGGAYEPFNSHTHRILLKAGVWVVEDLRFPREAFALPQPVRFMALPIHFKQMSGSFCRPVLIVEGPSVLSELPTGHEPARVPRLRGRAKARSTQTPEGGTLAGTGHGKARPPTFGRASRP
jgi:arylformamidase